MTEEELLIQKLLRIEALYSGTTFSGEKDAAAHAIDRICKRLKELQDLDPPREYRFSLGNTWSKKLFVALLRRYNLKPYRYKRQKYTTVMVQVPKSFVEETLWPEFLKLDNILCDYLSEVTDRIISQGIFFGSSDEEVRNDSEMKGLSSPSD